MKKEYSALTRNISVIIATIISYVLIVLKIKFITDHFSVDQFFIELLLSFLCIIVPPIVAWCMFKYKIYNLLWGLPIVFLSVLIYSPEGLYFILFKGSWFFNKPDPDWVYGIYISVMFFLIQFVVVGITIGIHSSIKEKSKQKSEHELESIESEKQAE